MPGSVAEGKELVKDFVIKNNIKKVLDIGPGEGTYYYALQGAGVETLDAVEVWGPYIDEFQLKEKYNKIYISDVYYFDWNKLPYYDLVIAGDVIEHMTQYQGETVLMNAVTHAKYVAVSLPIYGYYQEATVGNTYETHVMQYSDESFRKVIDCYKLIESFIGGTVGVYIFERRSARDDYWHSFVEVT
jgi:hypothetical protein